MAQLLVKLVDSPTLADNPRGAYRRGDVVVVKSDAHTWGREEGPPNFAVIAMPGVTVPDAERMLAAEVDVDGSMLQRRAGQFDLSRLTAAEQAAIATGRGKVTVTGRALVAFEKNVRIRT